MRSQLADAAHLPSADTARPTIFASWPRKRWTSLPVSRSHSATAPSSPAASASLRSRHEGNGVDGAVMVVEAREAARLLGGDVPDHHGVVEGAGERASRRGVDGEGLDGPAMADEVAGAGAPLLVRGAAIGLDARRHPLAAGGLRPKRGRRADAHGMSRQRAVADMPAKTPVGEAGRSHEDHALWRVLRPAQDLRVRDDRHPASAAIIPRGPCARRRSRLPPPPPSSRSRARPTGCGAPWPS